MPWQCPACQNPVRPAYGFPPFPHIVYRCKLCGVKLTLDKTTDKLKTLPPQKDEIAERLKAETTAAVRTSRKQVAGSKRLMKRQ